jgi:enoyl-CoA hydratase/carnithine racemase
VPSAISATKRLIQSAPANSIEHQLDAERGAIIDCMDTKEFRAAIDQFLRKGK